MDDYNTYPLVTRTEYLMGMLEQALESCDAIEAMQDKPGDLVAMRQDLLRIRGILQVIVNKIDHHDYPSVDIPGLEYKAKNFLVNYYFEREMDIMEPLYGDDPGRLRHLRLKILEALQDKGLSEKMREIKKEL